jgi:hypothetical protein
MADHSPSALRTQCTAEFARRVERAGTYREDRIGKKREAEPKRNVAEGGGPAKDEDDRNWSRSSPLRIATHDDSPNSGGLLDAPVYPGGLRFARPAIKAVEDAVLTLATGPEQSDRHPRVRHTKRDPGCRDSKS